jgi:hypothetical protein
MKKLFFHHSLFGNWLNRFWFGTIIQRMRLIKRRTIILKQILMNHCHYNFDGIFFNENV